MAVESQPYADLLAEAEAGNLQLPEFQRYWKWSPKNVIELFDSVRKAYPIGSFLLMEKNDNIPITPRPFFADTPQEIEPAKTGSFILDGQQRITAGLIVFYGRGHRRRFYIDLEFLYERFAALHVSALAAINAGELSAETALARSEFLTELDSEDEYCTTRPASQDPRTLMIRSQLLDTTLLKDPDRLDEELARYKKEYPDRSAFVDYVVRTNFTLRRDLIVPVMVVEKDRPVEAICRIFATLNTTGRPLTPFELVVSLLYPHGIRLRDDVEEFKARSTYYKNMDGTGEILLQTIALLENEDPKKARLPKTITAERFQKHKATAYSQLEDLGKFLTTRLGLGLDRTNALIPYDSIFAPMAKALGEAKAALTGSKLVEAETKLEQWFVLSALDRRYQEGVHNKQKDDPKDFRTWALEGGGEPAWITGFRTPSLKGDSSGGARPALLKCLINRNNPHDPQTGQPIGFREHAEPTAVHHFFPIGYCKNTLKVGHADRALNLLLTTEKTNGAWSMSNPHDQLEQAIAGRGLPFVQAELNKQFVDEEAFAILRKSDKDASDYDRFLDLRERAVLKALSQWNISGAGVGEVDDAEDEA